MQEHSAREVLKTSNELVMGVAEEKVHICGWERMHIVRCSFAGSGLTALSCRAIQLIQSNSSIRQDDTLELRFSSELKAPGRLLCPCCAAPASHHIDNRALCIFLVAQEGKLHGASAALRNVWPSQTCRSWLGDRRFRHILSLLDRS